ncbi:K(+)/H(+) antiporter 1 [Polychaeton citri CBS 116435]|uniref:K(+)/H(+) antiporter 1 n=1 Tax=Polychaeton citri CBS 116435 TaxID=1314669 RepID=A0A9P4QDY6_9PEZI|nr:K(+)/H(+) antiporter 1 [Polychaeton citri CBS 116435]
MAQGGILEGQDPSHYDPKNPIILFILQACIILCLCRALHFPLSYLKEPRVVGEVLGGILLGPSVFGRIPGFTDTIFPAESIPNLSNVANLGLILFLFIIGLEVDLRYFFSNWKVALSVGLAGMTIPFALGAALSHSIYYQFRNEPGTEPVAYGTFLLFIGVAMAITAFPVLCRILTELKLLSTPVGIITLASGVGDDVVGWVLLALCVALVNAGSGITALYIILCAIGWALFLVFAIRPCFVWVLRRTHSFQDGPTQGVMVLTILLCLGSAFFTGAIGVHPIFGAFLAGLIMPHEGGFAIKVTEKIEDLMMTLFLPLYFTLSGLNTNLGLLDNGVTWGYLIAVTVVAFCSKFLGCSVAARLNGLVWRESFSIGALMSCKGLVELIVLNIGLQAKILSQRVFTMFVVMALITTFATTPLTSLLYPPWYQKKLEAWKRGEIDWESGETIRNGRGDSEDGLVDSEKPNPAGDIQRLLIYLRLDNMPNTLAFVSLFGGRPEESTHPHHDPKAVARGSVEEKKRPIVSIHGMRLVQLTARLGSVMTVSEADSLSAFDPVLNAFRVLGQLYNLAVSGEVAVVPGDSYTDSLVTRATEESSDLLLLPWTETGSLSEAPMVSKNTVEHKVRNDAYSNFIAETVDSYRGASAVFVNKNFSGSLEQSPTALTQRIYAKSGRRGNITELPSVGRSHHIFMPFFGGPDGQAAVRLALQLARNHEITITMIHYQMRGEDTISDESANIKSVPEGKIRVSWVNEDDDNDNFFVAIQQNLPDSLHARITFRTSISYDPVSEAIADASKEVGRNSFNGGDLIILGRSIPIADSHASRCLGLVADLLLEEDVNASVVVVQAARKGQLQHSSSSGRK